MTATKTNRDDKLWITIFNAIPREPYDDGRMFISFSRRIAMTDAAWAVANLQEEMVDNFLKTLERLQP